MNRRKHLPHGTLNGAGPEVKRIWFERDLEPELLSGEFIPDAPDELDPLRERDARVLAARALGLCKTKEAMVLSMRYLQGMSLYEIAAVFDVSGERIRQIERKAFSRIRARSNSDKSVRSFFA